MYVNKATQLGHGKVTRGIFLPLQVSLSFSIALLPPFSTPIPFCLSLVHLSNC